MAFPIGIQAQMTIIATVLFGFFMALLKNVNKCDQKWAAIYALIFFILILILVWVIPWVMMGSSLSVASIFTYAFVAVLIYAAVSNQDFFYLTSPITGHVGTSNVECPTNWAIGLHTVMFFIIYFVFQFLPYYWVVIIKRYAVNKII